MIKITKNTVHYAFWDIYLFFFDYQMVFEDGPNPNKIPNQINHTPSPLNIFLYTFPVRDELDKRRESATQ